MTWRERFAEWICWLNTFGQHNLVQVNVPINWHWRVCRTCGKKVHEHGAHRRS